MRQQLPILRDHSGLVYVKLARRLEPDGGEEVILFEEWRDATSLSQSRLWLTPDEAKWPVAPQTNNVPSTLDTVPIAETESPAPTTRSISALVAAGDAVGGSVAVGV